MNSIRLHSLADGSEVQFSIYKIRRLQPIDVERGSGAVVHLYDMPLNAAAVEVSETIQSILGLIERATGRSH
jgi:hypothetical protein